jgi:hypothetical protein
MDSGIAKKNLGSPKWILGEPRFIEYLFQKSSVDL